MQIVGKNVSLRLIDESDWTLFLELYTCPLIMEHVYKPISYQEAKKRFIERTKPWDAKSEQWLCFTIEDINSDEKIGSIGLKIINHLSKIAEVGYLLKAETHGKGYATDALECIKTYAFNTIKLNKLVARCSVNNIGSFKVLEKSGFSREGHLKENPLINNEYIDDYLYGLYVSDI